MTDLSRIYTFLGSRENWVSEADTDKKDGIITKKEFRTYMLNNVGEWNGESTVDENSIIDEFWKEVDYNISGLCADSKTVRNQNALDKNEQKKLAKKIQVYEEFEEFKKSNVYGQAPSGIKDRQGWMNSVISDLSVYVEKYIDTPNNKNSLEQELSSVLDTIKNKNSANKFAQEYLQEALREFSDIAPGYKGGGDLQRILDKFIKGLETSSDYVNAEDKVAFIQQRAKDIVDAFLATAKAVEVKDTTESKSADAAAAEDTETEADAQQVQNDENTSAQRALLAQYGYKVEENSKLNDLQQAVVETRLKEVLKGVKNEPDYGKYGQILDEAVNNYIDDTLISASFSEFNDLLVLDYSDFKNSNEYDIAEKTIAVRKYLSGEALKKSINDMFGEDIYTRFTNRAQIDAIADIESMIIDKILSGEYLNEDGTIDNTKIANYVLKELKRNMADLYEDTDLSKMNNAQLEKMYDNLKKSADDSDNTADQKLQGYRNAAKKYCKAAIASSSLSQLLEEAIAEKLGGDYNLVFDGKTTTNDINTTVTQLKTLVSGFKFNKDAYFANLKTEYQAVTGNSCAAKYDDAGNKKQVQLKNSITIGAKNYDTGHVSFKVNGSHLEVAADGRVTIKGDGAPGTYSGETISVYVDGKLVGTSNPITIQISKKLDFAAMSDTYNDCALSSLLNITNNSQSLIDRDGTTKGNAASYAKTGLGKKLDKLIGILKDKGFDATLLNNAKQTTVNYFGAIIDAAVSMMDWTNTGTYCTGLEGKVSSFTYVDSNGRSQSGGEVSFMYRIDSDYYDRLQDDTGANTNTSSGVCINYAYSDDDKQVQITLNTQVLIKKFQEFFNTL